MADDGNTAIPNMRQRNATTNKREEKQDASTATLKRQTNNCTTSENSSFDAKNNNSNNKQDESDEDVPSLNLLLTQDEWSSSDEERDEDEHTTMTTMAATAVAAVGATNATTSSISSTSLLSPATRTLNAFSQQSIHEELLYDKSRMDEDSKAVEASFSQTSSSKDVECQAHNIHREPNDSSSTILKVRTALVSTTATSNNKETGKTKVSHSAENPGRHDAADRPLAQTNAATDHLAKQAESLKTEDPERLVDEEYLVAQTLQQQQQSVSAVDSTRDPNTSQVETSPPLQPKSYPPLDLSNYQMLHVVVPTVGSFGCTVAQSHPPSDLMPCRDPIQNEQHCRIKAMAKGGGLAKDLGLQPGDWFLEDASGQRLAIYDTFLERIRSKARPLNLYLLRKKSVPAATPTTDPWAQAISNDIDTILKNGNVLPTTETPSNVESQQAEHPAVEFAKVNERKAIAGQTTSANGNKSKKIYVDAIAKKKRKNKTSTGDKGKAKKDELVLPNGDLVVPYCNLCNDPKLWMKKKAVHHALCPENTCFNDSGAAESLTKTIEGIRLGCPVCVKTYELGKVQKTGHIVQCPCCGEGSVQTVTTTKRFRAKSSNLPLSSSSSLKKDEKSTPSEIQLNKQSETSKTKKRSQNKPDQSAAPKKREVVSGSNGKTSSNTESTNTTKSVSFDKTSSSNKQSEPPKILPANAVPDPVMQHALSRQQSANAERDTAQPLTAQQVTPAYYVRPSPPAFHHPTADSHRAINDVAARCAKPMAIPLDDGSPCETAWLPSENPWGPDGHMSGDVVVLTTAQGLGHVDTELASERYEIAPFSAFTNYHKTHHTPQEGFHNVRLQRDQMAKLSWGLTLGRHEFGGACLVQSIDPLSPAANAVFLGSGPGEHGGGLRIHDMIIAVGGQEVGGMSTQGLHLELETAGPTLTLAVSRYRYADLIEDRMAGAENKVLATADDAATIDFSTKVGWVQETSRVSASDQSLSVIASKALEAQLQPEALIAQQQKPATNPAESKQLKTKNVNAKNISETPVTTGTVEKCVTLTATVIAQLSPAESPTPTSTEAKRISEILSIQSSPPSMFPKIARNRKNMDTTSNEESLKNPSSVSKESCDKCEDPVLTDMGDLSSEATSIGGSENNDASIGDNVSGVEHCSSFDGDREEAPDEHKMHADDNEDDEDDDGNPALGCICGVIHPGSFVVFWIQCDTCNAWYNVARKCVGFSEAQAEERSGWCCWACSPPDDESDMEVEPTCKDILDNDGYESQDSLEAKFLRKTKRQRRSEEAQESFPGQVFTKNQVVEVEAEGSHMFGGIAKVLSSYIDGDGDRLYKVKYIIDGNTEDGIPAKFVKAKKF